MEQVRIFVSHSSQDKAIADAFVHGLRQAGGDVWYDEHNLGAGHLKDVVQRELGRRPVFIVLLSKAAFGSAWVKDETDWADDLRRRDASRQILPVTIQPIAQSDFAPESGWLFLHGFRRIEAPGYQPYPITEAIERTVRLLGLLPQTSPAALAQPQQHMIETRPALVPAPSMSAQLPAPTPPVQSSQEVLFVLGGRYDVYEQIGGGGLAKSYRAVDRRTRRTVAVKVLRDAYTADVDFAKRFQQIAPAIAMVRHPNIVQVLDYGQGDKNYFLVIEYVAGTNLKLALKNTSQLENGSVVAIAHSCARGLGAAHQQGLIHRNIKPANIMLPDRGEAKVADLGVLSMFIPADRKRKANSSGLTWGSVDYYSPEQAQGDSASPASDVYSLGIVMYEMLCGRLPFYADTVVATALAHIQEMPVLPSAYNPRLTPDLDRIVLRCLEKKPQSRYRDGNALAVALENLGR